MKAETAACLDKARHDLADARAISAIGLAAPAARTAYYAAFHAAEAVIVERTGAIAKTHSGVRAKLAEFSRIDPAIDKAMLTFLAQAYLYKEINDYGIGREATVSIEDAEKAIADAARMLETIEAALSSPST